MKQACLSCYNPFLDLRPYLPLLMCVQAEDWEHEEEHADDDQDQGGEEVYEDDPGVW